MGLSPYSAAIATRVLKSAPYFLFILTFRASVAGSNAPVGGWPRLHQLTLSTVLTSPKVFADDTTLPVLDPGRGMLRR